MNKLELVNKLQTPFPPSSLSWASGGGYHWVSQWEGEVAGHCALPSPGAAQEDAGSGRFPCGLTRGRPSPRSLPGSFSIPQMERIRVLGKAEKECSAAASSPAKFPEGACPPKPGEAIEINGENVKKKGGEDFYLQLTTGDSRVHGAQRRSEAAHLPWAPAAQHPSRSSPCPGLAGTDCSRPVGYRGGVGVRG